MSNQILHEGKIDAIDGEHVRVRIVQRSACAMCKIAGSCMASESKVKIVDVWTCHAGEYSAGQTVTVAVSSLVGTTAVVVGFVVPLLIVVLGVVVTLALTSESGPWPIKPPYGEAVAATVGLALLALYYIGLYLARKGIRRRVSFTILGGVLSSTREPVAGRMT